METDWTSGPGCTQTWLISKSAAVTAVDHLDGDRGRFTDNVDPFEVKVGRRPVPLMGACLFWGFLSADKGPPPRTGWNSSRKKLATAACCERVNER